MQKPGQVVNKLSNLILLQYLPVALFRSDMPPPAYKLSFPCPHCGGVLTMATKNGSGNCPLCHCRLSVTLDIQTDAAENNTDTRSKATPRGWDSRAFRRPATTDKPVWTPLHEPAE